MKKSIIAASVLLFTGATYANECSVNIDGQLTLEDKVLTITTENRDVVLIEANHDLFVNGKSISLTKDQQLWVESYYQGITDAVPAVAEVAIEGVALATSTINEVFGNLLGADSSAIDDITSKLHEVNQKIQTSFYADNGSVRIDSRKFKDGNMLGQEWEDEFGQAIEEVISSSIGRIMMAIGSELLFGNGNGNMDDLESRMETFSEELEHKVEAQAAVLEQKANALCGQLRSIDYAENKLQDSIYELSDLNIITVKNDKTSM